MRQLIVQDLSGQLASAPSCIATAFSFFGAATVPRSTTPSRNVKLFTCWLWFRRRRWRRERACEYLESVALSSQKVIKMDSHNVLTALSWWHMHAQFKFILPRVVPLGIRIEGEFGVMVRFILLPRMSAR